MKPAPLPDLATLTGEEKDALIRELWQALSEARPSGSPEPDRDAAEEAAPPRDLRAELAQAEPSRRARTAAPVAMRLGRGLGLWRSKAMLVAVIVASAAFLLDFAVGWYQQRAIEERRVAQLLLENAAFGGLYVELVRVAQEPDGRSYRLTMTMQNTDPEAPLYVMPSPVRIFVQAGLIWQEVPAEAADGGSWGVVELTGGYDYDVAFQAEVEDWAELIPGYMHVRIDSDMFISRRREPTDDIVERRNRTYVYLKPHGADDEDIRRRSNMSGTPPVYIPMPPH